MKTSPNQDQSSGYSFADNATVDKRTDHAVSKKEIIAGCVVVCFFTIMAIGAIISMYFEPYSFPAYMYIGAAVFPFIGVSIVFLNLRFPHLVKPYKSNSFGYRDLTDTSGAAISLRGHV